MDALSQNTVNERPELPIKILQFGGGNFLRAFIDWMVEKLNKETDFDGGIAVVKPTPEGDYAELKAQDGLFTVVLDGIKNGAFISEKTLVKSVQKVIHSYTEWETYLELAKNPDIRFIISNTTEAGIQFNPDDSKEDAPPAAFPAKLTLWLYERFRHFVKDPSKGCILLPCELIEDNGKTLKRVVMQYATHWGLESDFQDWITTSNHFCSTLVDRIVSGYPSSRSEAIQKELGYTDDLLVAGEYYHSWVVQGDATVVKELPFSQTDLQVEFVDDLAPYRDMKVRILNGAHTSMVPVGYLAGIRFVEEAMNDETVSGFIESLLREEAAKTLNFSDQVKKKFISDVLDRFRNPLLKHKLMSISLNSTSKFKARLLPTMKDYIALEGKLPERIVFGLSALILFYKGEVDGEQIALKDDAKTLAFFASQWEQVLDTNSGIPELVENILGARSIWGEDLSLIDGLVDTVSGNIANIQEEGIRKSIQKINSPNLKSNI